MIEYAVMALVNIQYSANLEDIMDLDSLVGEIHDVVQETAEIKVGTLRTSAIPVSKYMIADCDPENMYIHVSLSFKSNDEDMLRRVGEAAFTVLTEYLTPFCFFHMPLEYSVDISRMDSWARGNIREKIRRERRASRNKYAA